MKKGLGLQANINGFNTTLPQTKHLNFFMGTNPVGYANGGAVRRGVPSSNMNVTQGFLPMALGFDNGGEADKTTMQSFYGFLRNNIKNYLRDLLGVEPSDQQVEDFTNSPQGQEVVEQIEQNFKSQTTPGVSAGAYDSGFPIGGAQKKEPPMPTETATDNITTDIGEMRIPEGFPDEPNIIDKSTDALGNILDFGIDLGGNLKEEFFPAPPPLSGEQIGSQLDELLKQNEAKNQPKVEEKKEEKKMITAEPTEEEKKAGSGITSIQGRTRRGGGDKLSLKEQRELQKTIKGGTGNEGKKDAPAWALPLMSAGFAMMASKSPNFLQALGEAGQEGIATLTAQKEVERAKRLEDAQIEGLLAQADKDRRGTSKVQIITDDQGRQVYATFNAADGDFRMLTKDDGTPRYATRSRSEISQEILKNQPMITEEELTKQVDMIINQELNVAKSNVTNTTKEDASGGFSFKDFGGNVIKELFS
jgi:hypothetical protein